MNQVLLEVKESTWAMDWSVEVCRVYRYRVKGCSSVKEAMEVVSRLIHDDVYPSPYTSIRAELLDWAEEVTVEPDGSVSVIETDPSSR